MRIGEVAKRLDMPASTIRYYERIGLTGRTARVSGRRDFDDAALRVLRFVRLAQTAGFSIEAMKSLRESYEEDQNPGAMWRSLAHEQRRSIRERMEDLRRMDAILARLLECDCATLDSCVEASRAYEPGR